MVGGGDGGGDGVMMAGMVPAEFVVAAGVLGVVVVTVYIFLQVTGH